MEKKDLQILSMLRSNGRMTLTEMSRRSNIPVSTIYDRLNYFRGSIIKRHVSLIDFAKLGFVVKTHIMFCIDKTQKDDFSAYMVRNVNVNSLYRINNGFDFIAEVLCRDINGLEQFLDSLCEKFKIKDKKTFFIIDEPKKEAFLSDESFMHLFNEVF